VKDREEGKDVSLMRDEKERRGREGEGREDSPRSR
jgi:hypothetical protein